MIFLLRLPNFTRAYAARRRPALTPPKLYFIVLVAGFTKRDAAANGYAR